MNIVNNIRWKELLGNSKFQAIDNHMIFFLTTCDDCKICVESGLSLCDSFKNNLETHNPSILFLMDVWNRIWLPSNTLFSFSDEVKFIDERNKIEFTLFESDRPDEDLLKELVKVFEHVKRSPMIKKESDHLFGSSFINFIRFCSE